MAASPTPRRPLGATISHRQRMVVFGAIMLCMFLTAIDQSGSKSSFCASVGPASDPTQWSLPWRAEWSLKDY